MYRKYQWLSCKFICLPTIFSNNFLLFHYIALNIAIKNDIITNIKINTPTKKLIHALRTKNFSFRELGVKIVRSTYHFLCFMYLSELAIKKTLIEKKSDKKNRFITIPNNTNVPKIKIREISILLLMRISPET